MTQTLALAALLTLVGVAAAGCGGSKMPSVASLATTTPTGSTTSGAGGTQSTKPSRAALASCFSAHGFQASVGSGSGSGDSVTVFGVTIGENVNPDSTQFQAAMQACRRFIPDGGPPALTPAQRAAAAKAMLSFASCMRKDGVPSFPDPNGEGRFPIGSIDKLDQSSPLFQSAFKSCQSLEPKVGPRIEFG